VGQLLHRPSLKSYEVNESLYKPTSLIDGIGPITEARYREAGIFAVSDLLTHFIFRLVSGAKLAQTEQPWFEVCLLLCVDGIDKDYADALVREDISIRKLDNLRADTILEKLSVHKTAGRLKELPKVEEIEWWRVRAARISSCPIIAVKFLDLSSARDNAKFRVEIAGKTIGTTPSGTALLYGVPSWTQSFKLYYLNSFVDFVDMRKQGAPFARVRRGYTAPVLAYERKPTIVGDQLIVPQGHRIEIERPALVDLVEGSTYLARGGNGAPTILVCERYAIRGGRVVFTTVRPPGLALVAGDRYMWNGGAFERIEA